MGFATQATRFDMQFDQRVRTNSKQKPPLSSINLVHHFALLNPCFGLFLLVICNSPPFADLVDHHGAFDFQRRAGRRPGIPPGRLYRVCCCYAPSLIGARPLLTSCLGA